MPHVNHQHERAIWFKQKTRPRMKYEWIEKKSDPNNRKNSKNQSEIAACEQKETLARKQIFVQTPFSHSTLKLE